MDRRKFISSGTMLAAGISILPSSLVFGRAMQKVRLGYIGVGLRGRNHIQEGLLRDDVEIVAICDTQEQSLPNAANSLLVQAKSCQRNTPAAWMLTKACSTARILMRLSSPRPGSSISRWPLMP